MRRWKSGWNQISHLLGIAVPGKATGAQCKIRWLAVCCNLRGSGMQVPTNVQYVECSVVLIVLEPKERL